MDPEQARMLLEQALRCASADEATVSLVERHAASTRFSGNAITQNLSTRKTTLSVRVACGHQAGSATTNRLEPDALKETVERAQAIARSSPPDLEFMPALGPQEYPEIDGFGPSTAEISPVEKARRLLPVFDLAKSRGLQMAGSFHTGAKATAVLNSRGLWAFHRSTSACYTNTAITPTSSGWAEAVSLDVDRIDPLAAARTAIEKAEACREPRDLAPGRYPVVLEAPGLADLLLFMVWSMDAKAAAEGRSFAAGRLGGRIAGEDVTIRSIPGFPGCPGTPFAADWMAARPVAWVEKGILRNLLVSRWWASRHKMEPTKDPMNLVMDGGASDTQGLVRSMKRGLLVTRFWYIRFVDRKALLLTGMTRDGLFWIEDGKIAYGVKNFRWNDSPLSVLGNIRVLGRPRITAGTEGSYPCSIPDAWIDGFNFSSPTEF